METVGLTKLLAALSVIAAGSTALAQGVYEPYEISTYAGMPGVYGSTDGSGSAARFSILGDIAVDNAGNAYVADKFNSTIRKITPGGLVTTLAGFAGAFGSSDGIGSAARFIRPTGVTVDSAGNVYVADNANYTIRKITPDGVVSTLAGLAGSSGTADGTGTAARFYSPMGVAVDIAGNVYVTDSQTIRKVTAGGVVTTLAGLQGATGAVDGQGSAARFYNPRGIAVDSAGNVYVGDSWSHHIRKITPNGFVTTLAGFLQGYEDTDAHHARFNEPSGIAVDGGGNVYVADYNNHCIRKLAPYGVVTTLAGRLWVGSADGIGSDALFRYPRGVAVDSAGTLFIADSENFTIRRGRPAFKPTLNTITPNPVVGSNSPITLTLTGNMFVSGAKVQIAFSGNGYTFAETNTSPTVTSATTLTVPITTQPQADTWHVRVKNPDGQISNALDLVVTGPSDPAPTISGISPSTVTGSTNPVSFTVKGSNFVQGTRVQVGYADTNYSFVNTKADATYVNASTLTVPITTQLQADTWRVRVINPDGQPSASYVNLIVKAPAAHAVLVDHFVFATIPSPQSVDTAFGVSISAVNANGQTVTAFSGNVNLTASSAARVTPVSVTCSNGQWAGTVSLDQPGYNTSLRASNGSVAGTSNEFEVRSPSPSSGKIQGFVRNSNGLPLSNASVLLSGTTGGFVNSTFTTIAGYRFDSVPPGTYVLSASANGLTSQTLNLVSVGAGATVSYDITVSSIQPIPVLLVPGIVGTTASTSLYPVLIGQPGDPGEASKLRLYDPYPRAKPVWGTLITAIEAGGHYKTIPVPWDWRLHFKEAYKQYLMLAIDRAKRSPQDKVSIVAHSLGGLMVRAYVQSADYRNDIDKLALVGTPNEGAAIVYYIAEGADPLAADTVSNKISPSTVAEIALPYLYTNTLDNLYSVNGSFGHHLYNFTLGHPFGGLKITTVECKAFIDREIPGLSDLLPTFRFLNHHGTVDYVGSRNTSDVLALHSDVSRYSAGAGGGSLIATRLFLSKTENTVVEIPAGQPGSDGTYVDGTPTGPPLISTFGDGTVLKRSVLDNLAFVGTTDDRPSSHPSLMSTYSDRIAAFLQPSLGLTTNSQAAAIATTSDVLSEDLRVSIIGRVQPSLTDPNARFCGIDLQTGNQRIEIPDATLSVTSTSSDIYAPSPLHGAYTLQIKGMAGDLLTINVAATAGSAFDEVKFGAVCKSSSLTFGFVLGDSGKLQINDPIGHPSEISSHGVNGLTVLSWNAPQSAIVSEYHIYGRKDTDSQYTLIGTTTGTSFTAAQPWTPDGSGEQWTYLIVAASADGQEGYFTEIVHNSAPTIARFTASVTAAPAPVAVTFSDQSTGNPSSWSWDFDGDGIIDSSEQNPTHVFSQPGNYTISLTVTGPNGSDTRTEVSYVIVSPANHLANISTRLSVGTGDNAMIGGFIVTGMQPKKLIVRGIGPSLGAFGVQGALADPTLELHDSSGGIVAFNDNWKDAQQGDIQATTLAPNNDLESAILRTLNPGNYTAVLRGSGSTSGIGVVEVYDLDQSADSKLANISTRGFVDTGDNAMIGGTIITGSSSTNVLVRAIGPSLSNAGVANALQDPTLELHDGNGALIDSNDNWVDSPDAAAISATTIPPTDPRESAILQNLPPGNYTAIVRGAGNTTGVAVVEAYQLQ